MTQTIIHKLGTQGQSIWCDNISRGMIDSGELQRLIDVGVVGVTSNPTIFMKAITGSTDYDDRLRARLNDTDDVMKLYEGLVMPDIADGADILRPVYDRTGGLDGFISLEVSPRLAFDTSGTIDEARRLFAELGRPNVFIKVPATTEGIPAIQTLISEGINVNVTLIFSLEMYERVMDAYIGGLQKRAQAGGDLSEVASVASFFVSRVDTLVDKLLAIRPASDNQNIKSMMGQAAIANARLAYARFQQRFDKVGMFGDLTSRGAHVQRPLWASTSTKNPDYPDTLYVDTLVGEHTVNTLPPNTIEAVLDHGATETTITKDVAGAKAHIAKLKELGIGMEAVTDQLLREGVASFAKSFDELLENLAQKAETMGAAS